MGIRAHELPSYFNEIVVWLTTTLSAWQPSKASTFKTLRLEGGLVALVGGVLVGAGLTGGASRGAWNARLPYRKGR